MPDPFRLHVIVQFLRIGINAKALSEKNPTGVAEYARALFSNMLSLSEAGKHSFVLYCEKPCALARRDNVECRVMHSPLLWTQFALAKELWRRKPDVFFTPQHVLPKTAPENSVVTIHGLEYEKFPRFYTCHERAYLRCVTKNAVARAAHIIAVSEATKKDLMEIYGVPSERIWVVYHGWSARESGDSGREADLPQKESGQANCRIRANMTTAGCYFLYIGRIELKKNVDGIIKAFEIAKSRYHLPHKLVLAGRDAFGANRIKTQAARGKFASDIEFSGYISAAEKQRLLAGAEAFVFPSWYEGFGLPVLEAQAAGIPVITSNVSSMPEVAGGAAELVGPGDYEAIALAMERLANDVERRGGLVSAGFKNLYRFSWENCARQTLAIITQ